ncbi:hypothetical protein VZT92_012900 [Zoarces viviparus]|uniref:Uncharacterized protein n=1 Tax=Zoarces viviparus TaxID=48416 RepID=A0AAW1F1X5_ZOAVI
MCSALILLPFTQGERRGKKRERANRGHRGNTDVVPVRLPMSIMIHNPEQRETWSFTDILFAHYHPSPQTISNITASSSTAQAGSYTESRVGGWAVGQAMRCETLLGLRQQLSTGLLLQTILAVKLPAMVPFQQQVRDILCYRVKACAVH